MPEGPPGLCDQARGGVLRCGVYVVIRFGAGLDSPMLRNRLSKGPRPRWWGVNRGSALCCTTDLGKMGQPECVVAQRWT